MFYCRRKLTVVLLALAVTACNTTSVLKMPKLKDTDLASVAPGTELQPIAFHGVTAALKRGTVIAHFPASFASLTGESSLSGSLCNKTHQGKSTLEWSSGGRMLGGWSDELGEVFFDSIKGAGYNIVGDPRDLFEGKKNRDAARYLIGARIMDVKGNICEDHDLWYGRPQGRYSAEFYQIVEWSIYEPITKKVMAKFKTEGYGRKKQPSREGIMQAFSDAFASATEGLAGDRKFLDLMQGKAIEDAIAKTESQRGKDNFSILNIKKLKLSRSSIREDVARIINGTVTVRVGLGHGSGFVIAKNGYILTNNHVVGTAKKAAVIFSNGVEVTGDVLRRDEIRDVALIKVKAQGLSAHPLDVTETLKPLDAVYAAGTPQFEELKATITKGVVSAFRKFERQGRLIQADVDISGGNSGGPLFNDKGNVVGISVAGYGPEKFSAGLNLFIPIKKALESLNITMM